MFFDINYMHHMWLDLHSSASASNHSLIHILLSGAIISSLRKVVSRKRQNMFITHNRTTQQIVKLSV